jgi:hypothetical protein
MAYGISVKEGLDAFIIKQRMVSKVNMLSEKEAYYLIAELSILIDINLNKGDDISDKNTQKEFISFLIRLFY